MIAKALRLIAGILLLPVVIGYSIAFAEQLLTVRRADSAELLFLLGVTAYLAFHVLVAAPNRAYVFGHELTHAAAAWISGGKVKGFKVGASKGSVTTNKITAFISLAPYLIPVYAILWTLGFSLAGLFWSTGRWVPVFLFGLGATLTFHLVFTVNVLKLKQSDLEVVGPILALVLIVLANVTLVAGVMSLVTPEVRFSPYLANGFHHTQEIYRAICAQLFVLR